MYSKVFHFTCQLFSNQDLRIPHYISLPFPIIKHRDIPVAHSSLIVLNTLPPSLPFPIIKHRDISVAHLSLIVLLCKHASIITPLRIAWVDVLRCTIKDECATTRQSRWH